MKIDATPPSLRQRKKDATHQAISDAAWELFAEKGYDETSVNDIAERANVAPRTFFRYFPTKEAVLYPEIDTTIELLREAFLARPADEPVITSLITALTSMPDTVIGDHQRNKTRLELMKTADNLTMGDFFRRRLVDEIGDLVRIRDAGRSDVELRARLASGVIGLIIDTSRDLWLATGATEALPDVGQRCMSLVVELLAVPANPVPDIKPLPPEVDQA